MSRLKRDDNFLYFYKIEDKTIDPVFNNNIFKTSMGFVKPHPN